MITLLRSLPFVTLLLDVGLLPAQAPRIWRTGRFPSHVVLPVLPG